MYNRYIPRSDGSFQRQSVPDSEDWCPCQEEEKQEEKREKQEKKQCHGNHQSCHRPDPEPSGMKLGDFLKTLFPRGLDTGDLMVILLMLLISQDCREDRNTALLTLALYLFL